MEISKENINEAEKVVDSYRIILMNEDTECGNEIICTTIAIRNAIQDRQSVLDFAKVAVQTCTDDTTKWWEDEITNLQQQIIYLQSKI